MWELIFKSRWGCYFPYINYKIVFQWGPDCLEINLNVSWSCVPSIRLAILHHELSRYVCLITEQLFKFLSSWLLCSYQSLYTMHHFCSGRNGNPLNWRLDSSALFVNLYFFLTCLKNILIFGAQKNVKGTRTYRLQCTMKSKEKQIWDFDYLSSRSVFTSIFFFTFLYVFIFEKTNMRLINVPLSLCRLCSEGS